MRMPHDTMCTGAPHACSLFYFYVWAIHDLHCLADPYVRRRSVASNPWATAHLGHLELRSTCELTRLAQRGRRATAMARTSPATQGSTIMAPRGVLQPLGYGSIPGAPGATELRSTIARHEVRQPSKYPRSCRRVVCRNPSATDPLGAHALFFPWRHSCDAPLV